MLPEDDDAIEGSFRADDALPEFSLSVPQNPEKVVFVPVERIVERKIIVERPIYQSRIVQPSKDSRLSVVVKPIILILLIASGGIVIYFLSVLFRSY